MSSRFFESLLGSSLLLPRGRDASGMIRPPLIDDAVVVWGRQSCVSIIGDDGGDGGVRIKAAVQQQSAVVLSTAPRFAARNVAERRTLWTSTSYYHHNNEQ